MRRRRLQPGGMHDVSWASLSFVYASRRTRDRKFPSSALKRKKLNSPYSEPRERRQSFRSREFMRPAHAWPVAAVLEEQLARAPGQQDEDHENQQEDAEQD